MSSRADRHNAQRAWFAETIINIQRHHEAEQLRRKNDVRAELASSLRAWFAGELGRLSPTPHQPADTVLGERVGLPGSATILSKRASTTMRFYGRTSDIEKQRGGTRIRCALNCREASASKLRRAFAKVHKMQLRQMRNADLKTAGIVVAADVADDGIVDLTAVITDATAALKVSERAYTGCLVSMDGDAISDISLVDSPAGFLEKASNGVVFAKIYNRGVGGVKVKDDDWKTAKRMSKTNGWAPALNYAALKSVRPVYTRPLPDAVEKALQERQCAEDIYRERPNEFTKAAFVRADTATRIAVIGAQRPAAVGDDAMVRFLRHGRA